MAPHEVSMILALLLACPSTMVVGDGVSDTAADALNTDTAADTANDSGADTASAEPVTDWEDYDGERTFSATTDWGSCEESTEDEGEELTDGDEYDAVMESCEDCVHVFENDPVEDSLCYGTLQLGRTWRGVELDSDGTAGTIRFYSESDEGLTESYTADFSFDGELLEFEYSFDYYNYPVTVTGEMSFEMVLPE